MSLSRRHLLMSAGAATVVSATGVSPARAAVVVPPARADLGVGAYAFEPGQVRLTAGRWLDNQNRTLAYLRSVDVNRLLYVFRANHRLSTGGAAANGGWDAPTFPFRSHVQGHFLTAWAQAWAVLGDTTCRDKATLMVAELARCQANNAAAGFAAGYLSGFPESDFTALEARTLSNGNVPYYCVHKTLTGLLDVWRLIGSSQARDVLLRLAGWVDTRTARLSQAQMQAMLGTEFGGMNEVLADLYQQTGDARWLTAAQRFDHRAVFDPLAADQDRLAGLHANTQVPKWIGAAREFKATGTTRYRDIARNAWQITTGAHTYAIGGNSQAEHFRAPNAIAGYLTDDTCEHCNTHNMLKLTRELWLLEPSRAGYFDFYERALLNHVIGAQNPADPHGHVTYFTPLRPGGRRGAGPAWGGGTWSTDYGTFWCCQGTGLEANTRLMDSIYFHNGSTLTVNLFAPSVLTWSQRGITVTQSTSYPASDTTTLTLGGTMSGSWSIRVRIPAWATGASLLVNGVSAAATPGTYATVTRTWAAGDTLVVRLPMRVVLQPANDNPAVQAITYGPSVLCGEYSGTTLPVLDVASVTRTSARANGSAVRLVPFQDAQGFPYTVYWQTGTVYKLVNAGTGLVLGVQDMSTADGGLAVQWGDTGTADHRWTLSANGDGTHKIRNGNSGKLLAVLDGAATWGAAVVQDPDNGSADNRWRLITV